MPRSRRLCASDTDLQRVVAAIEQSQRPFLYLGRGSGDARDDLVRLAERLESPVCTTFQGKSGFPEHHPLWLWPGFGPSAPAFVRAIAGDCDLTLAIGCRFSEVATGSYGLMPPGRLIHIDVDPAVIGRNYPASIGIAAEACAFISALLPELRQRATNEGLRDRIRAGHAQLCVAIRLRTWVKMSVTASAADFAAEGATQGYDLCDRQRQWPFHAAETLRLDAPQSFLAPVDFSCMGYAIPTAIGAAFGCPGRHVVALGGGRRADDDRLRAGHRRASSSATVGRGSAGPRTGSDFASFSGRALHIKLRVSCLTTISPRSALVSAYAILP